MLPQARSALGSRSSSQYCDFNYHICSRSLFDRLVPAVFRTAGAKDVDPRIWHCFVALTAARIIATIDQPDQSPCSTRGRHELWQTLSLSSRENSTRERENLADSFVARNLAADDSKMSRTCRRRPNGHILGTMREILPGIFTWGSTYRGAATEVHDRTIRVRR